MGIERLFAQPGFTTTPVDQYTLIATRLRGLDEPAYRRLAVICQKYNGTRLTGPIVHEQISDALKHLDSKNHEARGAARKTAQYYDGHVLSDDMLRKYI